MAERHFEIEFLVGENFDDAVQRERFEYRDKRHYGKQQCEMVFVEIIQIREMEIVGGQWSVAQREDHVEHETSGLEASADEKYPRQNVEYV